jgi:anti-sigma factor RsiW
MSFFPKDDVREEELAALADGSLSPERAAVVEAHVMASPELTAALDEQRRAVATVRGAAGEVDAPAALRERIDAQRTRRRAPGGR